MRNRDIRALFDQGEPFAAYDLVRQQIQDTPQDVGLLELCVRAEERLGLDDRIDATLDALAAVAPNSEELHGFRGKLFKRRARQCTGADREAALTESLRAYQTGYEITGGYWTGINVATLLLMLGNHEDAVAVAHRVQAQAAADDGDWARATVGDALLIQGEANAAIAQYETVRASMVEKNAFDMLSSVRTGAREILAHHTLSPDEVAALNQALRAPRFAMCVGHMPDRPDRSPTRFPASSESAVAATLAQVVDDMDVRFGVSSLASGADTMFQEVLAARNRKRHIVLPYPVEAFRDVSVFAEWSARFDRAMDGTPVSQVLPFPMDAEGLEFDFCNRFVEGLAQMRAEQAGADLVRIAVWDGKPGDGRGGTAGAVDLWRAQSDVDIHIIDPATGTLRIERVSGQAPRGPRNAGAFSSCALLFADAIGFSKLNESQNLAFVETVLGGIGEVVHSDRYRDHVRVRNTWGDAMFFVLDDMTAAGELALDLRDHMNAPAQRRAYRAQGLPEVLNLRIALHAAVVHLVTDPITGVERVAGAQISHAARIEPITPPGQVYASEAFAALSREDRASGFHCNYVGATPLGKGFGTFPTYHVRRTSRPG